MAPKVIAIIGGGPAGAMAAEKLARGGANKVTVFEEKLGWEKPCGGGVTHKALRRYPFLAEAGGQPTGKYIREAEFVAPNGTSVKFHLRKPLAIYARRVLNHLLLRRAEEAGAEVIQDRIRDLQCAGPGWELSGQQGSYRADYLILAAGARTALRRLLTLEFGPRDLMLTFGYYVPSQDPAIDGLRVQFFENFEGYAWAFPRLDHLSVGICGKMGEEKMAGLQERLHGFMRRFGYVVGPPPVARDSGLGIGDSELRTPNPQSRTPAVGSGPDGSEAAPRHAVHSSTVFSHVLPALSVESWGNLRLEGPSWALAGDAAGLVDPVTGEGICYAMRSGELLAEALLEGLPALYPERVREEFGRALALGARLVHLFYHGDFLGAPVTTRLLEFGVRSRRFRQVLQDVIEGSQSYLGLAARLYLGLTGTLWEMAAGRLREARPSPETHCSGAL
jgi:flavin-dependent dehydrogenase